MTSSQPSTTAARDPREDAPVDPDTALDVWLLFLSPDDEDAHAEANTFRTADGFAVEWYLSAVGLVTSRTFPTYAAAVAWLAAVGYMDFTS